MAETVSIQASPEQVGLENGSAIPSQGVSKTPTTVNTEVTQEQTNGTPLAPEAADPVTAVASENGTTQVPTPEAVDGNTQIPEEPEPVASAPVQTTTGEPNGTNGVSTDTTQPVQPEEDDDETPLFSPSLISPEVASLLPEGYTIRPLRKSDYHKGFLDTLRVLTTVGTPTFSTFSTHFTLMKSMPSTYHTLVILDSSSAIVGTGAVIVERKFIHNMGLVGHIEDIAVAKNQQGKKLGLRIIQALDYVAEKVGCYKCILDCSEANEGFYVKCGFRRAGLEMAHYYGRD